MNNWDVKPMKIPRYLAKGGAPREPKCSGFGLGATHLATVIVGPEETQSLQLQSFDTISREDVATDGNFGFLWQ